MAQGDRATAGRQAGVSSVGFVLILLVVGFAALMAMRISPMYMDYFTIRSTLEGLSKEPGLRTMPVSEIRARIGKRFDINAVTVIKSSDIKVTKDGSTLKLEIDYEARNPLIGNLDVVGHFKDVMTVRSAAE